MELARTIAAKSLPSIKLRKIASSNIAGRTWVEVYVDAQKLSATLTGGHEEKEGGRSFLEGRKTNYLDR